MLKNLFYIFLLLISLITIIFIEARYIEPNILIVKKENLYLPNWNKKLNNLKIAVITDLHIGTKTVNIKKVKEISKRSTIQILI